MIDHDKLAAERARLERQYRSTPTAETAFELGRIAYWTGDYRMALARFSEAFERAPDHPGAALALVRTASNLGRHDIEARTLARAESTCPPFAPLALHAALVDSPGALDAAADRLAAHPLDPLCAEFAQALRRLREGGRPCAEFADERAHARAAGLDWLQRHGAAPSVLQGLPIAVLERAIESACIDGLVLEFGVYFGRSLGMIAASQPGTVHGFDSFQGLPEAWKATEPAGSYSTGGRLPAVPGNVQLHVGWFEDTLPRFLQIHPGPVRLLHIDCDLYSSTRTVLEGLQDRIVPGSVLVFDDLLGYPGFEEHELRAFEEFLAASGYGFEIVAAALLGREVAVRIRARPTGLDAR